MPQGQGNAIPRLGEGRIHLLLQRRELKSALEPHTVAWQRANVHAVLHAARIATDRKEGEWCRLLRSMLLCCLCTRIRVLNEEPFVS
jgi:hypothetical protein